MQNKNRIIKFRAWDTTEKKWYRFDSGFLEYQELLTGKTIAYSDLVKEIVLMQFTGLTDKNGKEIYEGDVLETDGGEKLEVKWNSMFACFRFGNQATHDYDIAIRMKIIGNIYENPELLSA